MLQLHLPLPHHKPLPHGARVNPGQWVNPPGLLGPAVNLVRPSMQGHRRTVWWALLGNTLLFDIGANAVLPTFSSFLVLASLIGS